MSNTNIYTPGIALYSLAVTLSENFKGTLEALAKIGYKNLEFVGPYYYSSKEEIDTNFLIQQMGLKGYGYHGNSPKALKTFLDDLGLSAPSAHVSLESLEYNLEEAINAAHIIGHQYIVCPFFLGPDMDAYKNLTESLNRIGAACSEANIQFLYHNHSFEFGALNDQIPMDYLLNQTHPEHVNFELDLFWTTIAGVNPLSYFDNYPGRFSILHLKDIKSLPQTPDTDWQTFTQPEKIQPIMQQQVAVGTGAIDFKSILAHTEKAGTKHLLIESDFPLAPLDFATESYKIFEQLEN